MLTDAAPRHGARAILLVFLAALIFGACTPDGFLTGDEDRERNFQRARDAERLGEFEAAANYYESALERNPRAANVTLAYAALCEIQLKRFADAVYLYQRYLKLFPEDPRKADIERRITNCKERLATSVPVVIRSETIARDLAAVRTENQQLRGIHSNLVLTVSYWSNEWRKVSTTLAHATQSPATPAAFVGTVTNASSTPRTPAPARPAPTNTNATARAGSPAPTVRQPRSTVAQAPLPVRTHSVRGGETLDQIARRYGVAARAIQQANPGVDPRRMHAGTVLRIPSTGR